jgi:phosphinothricin acetyltransferase
MVCLRLANTDDAEAFAAIYGPFVRDTYVTFEEEPPSAEEMAGRIERTLHTHPWLAAEEEGKVVGFAYGSPHRERRGYRWAADVAIYLAPEGRGRGIGRALYRALIPLLREQGFAVAYAGIALPNEASVGLHEAMGFRRVALYEKVGFKAGGWHDVGWWGLDLLPRESPPREVVPFGKLPRPIDL